MFSPTSAWSDLPLAPDEKTSHRDAHLPLSMPPAQEAARAGLTIAALQHDTSLMRSAHSFILAERRLPDFAPGSGGTHDALSAREREIASLAATGASNAVIAHRLHVSIRTVEGHLQQIYRTLQVGPPAVPAGAFA